MKKGMALKPVKPNWALGNAYRVRIMKMTRMMLKDVLITTEDNYINAEGEILKILEDAAPLNKIYQQIKIKLAKWENIFIRIAAPLSTKFVEEVNSDVTRKINKSLEPVQQFAVVKFSEYDKNILNANQALIQENVDLITNIPVKLKEQIQIDVTQAISRGRDHKYLAEKLRDAGKFTERRVKTITRDQINKATSVINHASQASLGITKQEWVYTGISKEPRQSHVQASGKTYPIDKGCLIDGEYIYPAEKINCFPDDALIDNTHGIEATFRRWYAGKLTQFITKCGTITKSTPNHPLLTLRGWVNANLVNVGDYAIKVIIRESISGDANCNKSITTISDIFNSFSILSAEGGANTMSVRDGNFHGEEIIDQNIDIVLTNRKLMYSVQGGNLIQQVQDFNFTFANVSTSCPSSVFELLKSIFGTSQALISFLSDKFTLFERSIAIPQSSGFRGITDANIIINKAFSDDISGNIISFSNGLFRLPIIIGLNDFIDRDILTNILRSIAPCISQCTINSLYITVIDFCNFNTGNTLVMQFDQIININSIEYTGHVYNLQTKNDFYSANGVLYHNCKCVSAPYIEFDI